MARTVPSASRASAMDILSFLVATDANSLSTWTLSTAPSATTCSARFALDSSAESRYRRTFVSTNRLASLILFQAIKFEVLRKASAELSQLREQLARRRAFLDLKGPRARDLNLDFVAFLESQRLDHGRRQTHRQTVPPLRNLHHRP